MEMNSSVPRPADQHEIALPPLDTRSDGSQSDLPHRKKAMEQKKSWREWAQDMKTFIYNPEKGEVLGRNKASWCKILLFYLLFYIFLAGMFALCIYVLLLTIDPYVPTYRDRVFPPGVTIRPHVSGFHFSFNASERSTWEPFTENMNTFLQAYNDDIQIADNIDCTPGEYFIQIGEANETKKSCQFPRSDLLNCSGIEDPTFGFSEGKPCFLLKMNRIVGYEAGDGVPIYVTCEVVRGAQEDLGTVVFYPTNYFDLMYFPYYGKLTHVNYTSPLIAMQFIGVRKNQDVTIQCKLNGKNIISDNKNDKFLGRIVFILNIG
ncbi:protein ATP1B4 [Discoglossus pictus]